MDAQHLFQLHVAQYERVSHDVRQFIRAENNLAAFHNAEHLRGEVLTLIDNAETVSTCAAHDSACDWAYN